MSRSVTADDRVPPTVNPNTPTIARVYDYWLDGKDNFAVDRELAEKFMRADPMTRAGVRSNRAFLGRAVRFLAGEAGITQFLDVGTGIPTASNTHEVAQSVNPLARVVYVDNDPMVLAHARALLTSVTAPTAYVDADARDTGKLLAEAARTLDRLDRCRPQARQVALRPAELVEQRPVALHHQPQVLGVRAGHGGRAVRECRVIRQTALPLHAQLPLPLPQRADQRLSRLLDQVGGIAHGLPGVIDEPGLRPLPP